MGRSNARRNVMDPHKKGKGVTAVWRAISSQPVPDEAKDVNIETEAHRVEVGYDEKSEVGVQVQQLDGCGSASVPDVKRSETVDETISELDKSSTPRLYYDQDVNLEEDRATPSTTVKVEHVAPEADSTMLSANVEVESLHPRQFNPNVAEPGETRNKEQVKEESALKSDLEESEKHMVTVERCNSFSGLTYHGRNMGQSNARRNVTDPHKKGKGVTAVWRAVSSQPIPVEGCSAKDVNIDTGAHHVKVGYDEKSEVGVQVQKLDGCGFTSEPDVKRSKTVDETISELDKSSTPRLYHDQDVNLEEGRGTPSTTVKVEHAAPEEDRTLLSTNVEVESLYPRQFNPNDAKAGETTNKEQVKEERALKSDLDESEKHSVTVEVAPALLRFIKGKGGATQKQIEEEMGVKIILPSSKEDFIVIEGISLENVTKASEKIQDILLQAIKSRLEYSHFVSLPLAIHSELVDKLINFQNSVLGNSSTKQDEDLESHSSGDTSEDGEDKDDQLNSGSDVAVDTKVEDDGEHVEVKINAGSDVAVDTKVEDDSEHVEVKINAGTNVTVDTKPEDDSEHVEMEINAGSDVAVATKVEDDSEQVEMEISAGSDVAVDTKVEDDSEHVEVKINKIPIVSYLPKASKSSTSSDSGIDKSIFIKPKTFHLTVLMLKLWNEERVAAATEVLQRVSPKVVDALNGQPISVRLKGLECMRGSPAKARVLYAPVEELGGEGRLLRACQVIIDAYVEAGLVLEKDAQQKLKLHATVMNARHRKRKREKRTKRFDSFDARGIIKQHGSEEWGEYLIREAHLSQRFAFDDTGYYHCCAKIPFPENMHT